MTTALAPVARPRGGVRLIGHEFRFDLLAFARNKESVFFTLALPVIMLFIFASVFRSHLVVMGGGPVKESVFYVPGIISFGVIAATFANLTVTVVHYRETGVYKRRRATPVSAAAVIVGRALVSMLTTAVIAGVLIAYGGLAYHVTMPARTVGSFVLTMLVGAVCFSCLGFALASVIRQDDAAQPVAQGILVPLCFISGVFLPVGQLPVWLADVGRYLPLHALTDALITAYNPHTVGTGLNWVDLGLLAAWAVAGMAVATWRFSWLPRGG